MASKLRIVAGHFSDAGRKDKNQDCTGFRGAEATSLTTKGFAAAIADGVSSSEHGGEAAAACVHGFLADYFSTPDSWSVKKSAQQIFTALNSWLYRQDSRGDSRRNARVTTLSAIIFKSTTAHLFHIGDSRIYLLREGTLEQLTTDHRFWVSADKSYLGRAMGIDTQPQIDYRRISMEAGDIFILTTDGVHDFLSGRELQHNVQSLHKDPRKAAEVLARQALANGSTDNVTCQVLHVQQLPSQDPDEVYRQLHELPFPPVLQEGMIVDGYRILRELHASNRSQLYLALDSDTGLHVALKTPSVNHEDDSAYVERFTMEEWVGRRIDNPHVLKVYEPTRRRRLLYHVSEYLPGQTLRQWMKDNPQPPLETVRGIVEQIVKGLQAFHRLEMLHQDLKPDNIMIDPAGTVKIVDFGSVRVAGVAEIEAPLYRSDLLGTVNYTAPEYLLGKPTGNVSDIFSLGVIVYEMLTGRLPYGELSARPKNRQWRKLNYISARNSNPSVPTWFDAMLRKAVHPESSSRYQELSEFLCDLRNPNSKLIARDDRPLLERDPVRFWQGLCAILVLVILALLTLR